MNQPIGMIFDFDDLLCNSEPLHVEASRMVFAEHGLVFALPDELKTKLYGRRIPEATQMVFDHCGVTLDKEAFLKRRRDVFLDLVEASLQPMQGLHEVMRLVEQGGYPRIIASSGERTYVDAGLKKLGIEHLFEQRVTGEDVTRGKPDPEVFLLASQRLGIAPAQCVVIEDATIGVAAAKRAGMRAIGVRNPFGALPQDLTQADIVVDHLGQITRRHLSGAAFL